MGNYITVFQDNTAEYTEKHSVFKAYIKHCETEEDFASFLSSVKKENFDARHNVFAYKLRNNNLCRFSDDSEPHGTAGKPILDVLNGSELTDVGIIVSRYFGGVLLGTGGLVRAYSTAAKECILSAEKCKMEESTEFSVNCDYSSKTNLEKLIKDCNGIIVDEEFTDSVVIKFSISDDKAEKFNEKLTEKFCGKLKTEVLGRSFTIFEKFF